MRNIFYSMLLLFGVSGISADDNNPNSPMAKAKVKAGAIIKYLNVVQSQLGIGLDEDDKRDSSVNSQVVKGELESAEYYYENYDWVDDAGNAVLRAQLAEIRSIMNDVGDFKNEKTSDLDFPAVQEKLKNIEAIYINVIDNNGTPMTDTNWRYKGWSLRKAYRFLKAVSSRNNLFKAIPLPLPVL